MKAVFPPLNLAAGVSSRGTLLPEARVLFRQMDAAMRDVPIQMSEETSGRTVKPVGRLLEASKPYIAAFLIVTILLTVWAGLCAA
jgi:hypothetical protein